MKINSIRKKQIIIFILTIFILSLVYIIYPYLNRLKASKFSKIIKPNEIIGSSTMENASFTGTDTSGKQYDINARLAISNNEKENIIHLVDINSNFVFKDNSIIKVTSKKGFFNKDTQDMSYEDEVKIVYQNSIIFSDNVKFLGRSNNITLNGNIVANFIDEKEKKKTSKFSADIMILDGLNKTISTSRYDKSKQVIAIFENEK